MTGAQLRRIREGLGLSCREMSQVLGVFPSTLWNYEKQKQLRPFVALAVHGALLARDLRLKYAIPDSDEGDTQVLAHLVDERRASPTRGPRRPRSN